MIYGDERIFTYYFSEVRSNFEHTTLSEENRSLVLNVLKYFTNEKEKTEMLPFSYMHINKLQML